MRVLAVDDEEPALEELLFLLHADSRVTSAEGAMDGTEALRRLVQTQNAPADGAPRFDVIFLDIHMVGLNGMDLARILANFVNPPRVVFVTAHEDFALQAFDLKAVDYLLKPLRAERLAEAVRRVAELIETERSVRLSPSPGRTGEPETDVPDLSKGGDVQLVDTQFDHVPVELGGITRFVDVADVAYAEAQGDYARLHTSGGSHLVRIALSTLEQHWRDRGFVRVHRRYLVALSRIDELCHDESGLSVRIGEAVLAVSRRNARDLRDRLIKQARSQASRNSR